MLLSCQVLRAQNTRTWRGDICVGDDVLHALARCCPQLIELDIASCHTVTDIGVIELCSGCPGIQVLVSFVCVQRFCHELCRAESGRL